MPTDACQFFYECGNCKALLRPKPGGLLCVLLVWFDEMSTDSGATLLLQLERRRAKDPLSNAVFPIWPHNAHCGDVPFSAVPIPP